VGQAGIRAGTLWAPHRQEAAVTRQVTANATGRRLSELTRCYGGTTSGAKWSA